MEMSQYNRMLDPSRTSNTYTENAFLTHPKSIKQKMVSLLPSPLLF